MTAGELGHRFQLGPHHLTRYFQSTLRIGKNQMLLMAQRHMSMRQAGETDRRSTAAHRQGGQRYAVRCQRLQESGTQLHITVQHHRSERAQADPLPPAIGVYQHDRIVRPFLQSRAGLIDYQCQISAHEDLQR